MKKLKPSLMACLGLVWAYSAFAHDQHAMATHTTANMPLIYQKHHERLGYHDQSPSGLPDTKKSQTPLAPSVVTGTRFNEQYLNKEIALWSLRQVNGSMPLVEDAWTNQVLGDMTAQMNALVRTQSLTAIPIIDDGSINAFAVPGGLIGINTGTILSAGGLDEVASVLAHEIAHLSQRHYEHNQDNAKKLLALQIGGLLTALVASSVSGDAGALAIIGSQTASAETLATHSREHEREADRVGQMILVQAGYDAGAMPRFFEKLHKQVSLHTAKNAFVPSFIQSHPFTSERMSESVSRAKSYPVPSMIIRENHAKLFDKLTWRLRYLTKKAGYDELTIHAKSSEGARLALVMYLADNARTDEAIRLITQGKFDKSDPLSCITHAHVLTKMRDHAQAVSVLSACQALYPERRDLRLHLAQSLIDNHESDKAINLIKPLTDRTPHDRQAWQMTQRAYEKSTINGTLATIYALHARSQDELWSGRYQEALTSTAQATKLAKENPQFNLMPLLNQSTEAIKQARDYKP